MYRRFMTKAITWEVLSNLLGGLIVWLFSGQFGLALGVTLFLLPVKLLLFIGHEKVWFYINWDRK